jgi:hypothetical protein
VLISIEEVRKGDIIVDGRSETEVKRIKHDACSSFGTHINNRECWPRGSKVRIKPGKAESQTFEESGLGDLEEDWKQDLFV